MRQAYFEQGIIREESGEFVGFSFGYDYCAEHEWGIKDIIRSFGIPTSDRKIFGFPKRTITQSVEGALKYLTGITLKKTSKQNKGKNKKMDILVFYPYTYAEFNLERHLGQLPLFHLSSDHFDSDLDKKIATAWDDHSFAIAVMEPEHKVLLKELYDAFLRNDVSIGLSDQSNPFGGSGLNMLIPSKVSKEVKNRVRDMDKEHEKMMTEFEKTGIENKLKDAGKKYFALSPRRIDADQKEKQKTKHNIVCWLNPMEQQLNNSGWFTIEELELWAKDKGPIPMTEQQRNK